MAETGGEWGFEGGEREGLEARSAGRQVTGEARVMAFMRRPMRARATPCRALRIHASVGGLGI